MANQLPRKLAAILYADVADYSRLTGEDEETTHRRLSEYLDLVTNSISQHQGKVVHYAGDAILADFSTVTGALECATSIQNDLSKRNQALPDESKLQFRIGINLGEVIEDRGDIYGNDVNIAARLESLADAGGVCISEAVRTAVGNKLPLAYEFMGTQSVKNIKDPIRSYQVTIQQQEERAQEAAPEFQVFELPQEPSIAILPFTNMSGDLEQEYFSDGITEDIITALSKIKNLLVIARNSTFTYKGKSVDVRQVSREQGVQYVLEGSVRKVGNHVRITAQLIDATTAHHIWAERYDRELQDIFAVQDEIMREIVVALDVQLNEGEQARAWSSGTTNVEAWECVRLGAPEVLSAKTEANLKAKALFEKAIELDPSYAIAWVMLGWIYQQYADVASLSSDSNSLESTLKSMLDCAQKALAADPSCADAYSLMAMYHLEVKEFDQALEMAEKSISLAPNNAENLGEASVVMNKTGQQERALELGKRAMRACPVYRPGVLRCLGLSYYLLGEFDSAIRAFKESIKRESEYLTAHTNLASIYGELGKLEEADKAVREILRLSPEFSIKAYMSGLSFSNPEILIRIAEGLRKAGLPE